MAQVKTVRPARGDRGVGCTGCTGLEWMPSMAHHEGGGCEAGGRAGMDGQGDGVADWQPAQEACSGRPGGAVAGSQSRRQDPSKPKSALKDVSSSQSVSQSVAPSPSLIVTLDLDISTRLDSTPPTLFNNMYYLLTGIGGQPIMPFSHPPPRPRHTTSNRCAACVCGHHHPVPSKDDAALAPNHTGLRPCQTLALRPAKRP